MIGQNYLSGTKKPDFLSRNNFSQKFSDPVYRIIN